eukprot:4170352-Lingulodinium_polyedra.AAC.1
MQLATGIGVSLERGQKDTMREGVAQASNLHSTGYNMFYVASFVRSCSTQCPKAGVHCLRCPAEPALPMAS